MDTSWNKVSKWYNSHLQSGSKTYHQTVIIPGLIKLLLKNIKRGGAIVDLACGQGHVTREIGRAGFVVKGVDLAPDLINFAKKNNQGSGIEFYVDDVSALNELTIKKIGQADAVTISLAIQNIENLNGVFDSVSKLLKPGGKCFMIMNHPYFRIPKQTSWGFEGSVNQYRRVDAYMSEKKVPIEMTPGVLANKGKSKKTWTFHRPLQSYIKAMNNYGFSLIDMEEWISEKVSQPGVRARAENVARMEIPMFMALIFSKQ